MRKGLFTLAFFAATLGDIFFFYGCERVNKLRLNKLQLNKLR